MGAYTLRGINLARWLIFEMGFRPDRAWEIVSYFDGPPVRESSRGIKVHDQDAITEARENLASLRRELGDALRAEIGANEDLQAELRSVAQDARQDRVEAVAERRDETFDAVVAAATDEQALALVDNRDAIDVLSDELRSLRDDGATRDDFADQRDELRTLQRDQRELVREIVDANDDLRADLLADTREVRRDIRRDFLRDSRDRFRRDRLPEDVTPDSNGG